jgi:hypothetical protein
VIECEPTAKLEVDNCAVPPLRVAVPRELEPSKNCTVPVAAEGETVPVRVTLCPYVEGFGLEDIEMVVLAWFTVWVRADEVLPL